MADKPIIFSAPMVRALLDGRKTQTRRVLKPQPSPHVQIYRVGSVWDWRDGTRGGCVSVPYSPGDRIWVRETWSKAPLSDHGDCAAYRADGNYRCGDAIREGDPIQWRSPIHMPRWASRLTLIVTDVRVQRLQDISEEDAIAEGVSDKALSDIDLERFNRMKTWPELHRPMFYLLWNSINAKRGYSWDSNPWCVALTFDVIKSNIDAPADQRGRYVKERDNADL